MKFLVKLFFPKANLNEIYLSFGKVIYESKPIAPDLLVHEQVHLRQQNYSYARAIWFFLRYRLSKDFRYRMELEAYREQLRFIYSKIRDRNKRALAKKEIARCISLPMYGMVSFEQALKDLS